MGVIEVMKDVMGSVASNKKKRGMILGIMIITCFFGLLIVYEIGRASCRERV